MELGFDASALRDAAEAACRAGLRAGMQEVDARDLAQDALLRALTSARPPSGVPLAAWVYGIAKNLGRDHAKSAQRREVPVDAMPPTPSEDDVTSVLAMRRALDVLPDPLREVVTLHELEEHSLRETAEALQIPFDTAKDRLRRAREQLRAQLGEADATLAHERTHMRRRAAAHSAAIVAAVYAALGDSAVASAATLASSTVATTTARVVPMWIAAIAGTALLGGGFIAGRLSAPPHAPMAAAAPAPAAAVVHPEEPPPAEPSPAEPSPAEPPSATPREADTQHAPRRVPPPPPDQAEHLLVDRARAGLLRGLHDEALVTLMAHARQFPSGKLAEERDVLIIEAYVRSGQLALARRTIARYRQAHPTGVLGRRVDALASELDRAASP